MLTTLAAVLTPAALERVVNDLRFGWRYEQDADAAQARLAVLLRAFTACCRAECRALAAQAFPFPD